MPVSGRQGQLEAQVLRLVMRAREAPESFVGPLTERLGLYAGRNYFPRELGGGVPVSTVEGRMAVEDAIAFLRERGPLPPAPAPTPQSEGGATRRAGGQDILIDDGNLRRTHRKVLYHRRFRVEAVSCKHLNGRLFCRLQFSTVRGSEQEEVQVCRKTGARICECCRPRTPDRVLPCWAALKLDAADTARSRAGPEAVQAEEVTASVAPPPPALPTSLAQRTRRPSSAGELPLPRATRTGQLAGRGGPPQATTPVAPSPPALPTSLAQRTDYGFEYVLPSRMRSFMANRNLVPVSYTRKVLQVENHHAQVYLQHQVARRVAADLEVLPGHEIHIDPALLFFILKVRRERLLEDTTAALQRATPEDLRRQLKVVFEGEQGVDEGGLAREFFRLLSARVFAADCGLFDPQVAQNARVLWFDKASACESTDFWLAGVVLGLVVYNNMPGLDVRFPPAVFKKIKDEPLGLEDLRHVHPDTHLSLCSLLEWHPEEPMSESEASALFEATFCLDFVVTYDKGGKVLCEELCPGGRDRAVTLANRQEFVRLYCEWLLGASVERQFEPFRKGVRRVCDSPLFNALDSAELELIVCGEQELDFAQLRRNAHYDGFEEGCEYVDHFWQLLLAFDTVQKKRFLSFVTGSDLAPVGGLQELQLVIQRNGGEPTERLPTAHTCFNLLLLPEYGSAAKLERMMTSAMQNAEGFGLE